MANDIMAQYLLGQVGQRGQRQNPQSAMAARLMEQGASTAPIYSPMAGLARALTGALGGYQSRLAGQQEQDRQERDFDRIRGYQDEERQRLAAITAGLFGGAPAPAAPAQEAPAMPSAPPSGPVTREPLPAPQGAPGNDPRALNAEAARRRDEVLANTSLTPEQQAAALAEVSAWRASAGGTPPMAGGYRANPGVDGVFAGIAPPSGAVPPVMPGGQPPASVAPQQPAAAPGAMQPNMAVLQRMMASGDPQLMQQAQGVIALMRAQQQMNPQTEIDRLLAAAGLQPGSPEAQRIARGILERRGMPPSTTVTVGGAPQVGTIPPGYQLTRDGESYRMEPIPGGPAAASTARDQRTETNRQQMQQRQGGLVVQEVDRVLGLMDNSWFPVTGAGGALLSHIPGTASADVSKLLDTIRAEGAFGRLQQMREASPTGGALGAVTENELRLLQASLGSLEQSQSGQQFRDNLNRVRNIYLDIVHGQGNGPDRARLSFDRQSETGGQQRVIEYDAQGRRVTR